MIPGELYKEEDIQSYLAGENTFLVTDYEVYKVFSE